MKNRESYHIGLHWENPMLLNYCPQGHTIKGLRFLPEDLAVRKNPKHTAKRVAIFTLDGDLKGEFNSIVEAANFIGGKAKGITEYLKGKCSIYKGHVYKLIGTQGYIEPMQWVSKKPPLKPKPKKKPATPAKPMIKFNLEGKELQRFESMGVAARSMKADIKNFKNALKKGRPGYYKGFIWKYAE
jgi:hypothetical protein